MSINKRFTFVISNEVEMDHIRELIEIEITELSEWKDRFRKNSFFELVFILNGKGIQSVEYRTQNYEPNDFFLLPYSKCHAYEIIEPTKFLFIRFTEHYFKNLKNTNINYSQWYSKLNYIIGFYDFTTGFVFHNHKEKDQVRRLLEIILNEKDQSEVYSEMLIANALSSILTIISSKLINTKEKGDNKFPEIIQHINQNIVNEDQLSIAYLSEKFNISNSYFSEYFRRNSDEPLKEYIQKTKLQIAINRIQYTQAPLQEIAWSLGFTDGSHLNKTLKKYFALSSSALRKEKK
ncbi:AraC family transcriptional regulator [Chryseobacterium paridis]|uniref:Helix-turn-helix domain-containing protein n=1 Tax=Chryseobacterium paridis TaxID=2800328 RepID=A0ABS1FTZ3_9FLAO|nr:helix-turn-helix transcriptional regulator [Chryseobacterium paridis]MBK1895880.1 helix-turn-helix domain-containing protein [Chryseobacterium paridis]